MRNAYVALALLVLIFIGTLINIHYLDGFVDELESYVIESGEHADAGDYQAAERSLRQAIDLWNSSDGYTHVFIRHSEINSTSDAFYELLGDILDENADSAAADREKLLYQLESIRSIEHLTPGSIL